MPSIHHALLIEAPIEKIYNALCTKNGLSEWWTPDVTVKPEVDSIAQFHFGSHYFKEMQVAELNPNAVVRWECIKAAEEWVGTTISFKLLFGDKKSFTMSYPEMTGQIEQQKSENSTLLIFDHDGWKDYTLMFAECSYTWAKFLQSLKLFCETGKGRPWPNQHRLT